MSTLILGAVGIGYGFRAANLTVWADNIEASMTEIAGNVEPLVA
jgi:hypothetical protein